ncbi:MAG: histidine phosphatase family protein [Candidatus Woesearchaeota archaeon]
MKFYFIRHAESTSDIEDKYGGDYDDPLTNKGKEQAKKLGLELKNKGIEKIYHSPKLRAKETAFIANDFIKANLIEVIDLRERNNYGVLTGLTKIEAKSKYPLETAKVKGNKMFHDILRSESYEDFTLRVKNCFFNILKENKNTFAIFSHGGFMFVLVREILNLGEINYEDCAYLEIEYINNKLKVLNNIRCKIK